MASCFQDLLEIVHSLRCNWSRFDRLNHMLVWVFELTGEFSFLTTVFRSRLEVGFKDLLAEVAAQLVLDV